MYRLIFIEEFSIPRQKIDRAPSLTMRSQTSSFLAGRRRKYCPRMGKDAGGTRASSSGIPGIPTKALLWGISLNTLITEAVSRVVD